jgi:hypothetical protein
MPYYTYCPGQSVDVPIKFDTHGKPKPVKKMTITANTVPAQTKFEFSGKLKELIKIRQTKIFVYEIKKQSSTGGCFFYLRIYSSQKLRHNLSQVNVSCVPFSTST